MAKSSASSPTATPPAALKRTTSSTQNMKNQKSILGFFQKSSPATPSNDKPREPASSPAQRAGEQRATNTVKPTPKRNFSSFAQDLNPVPSSDLPIPEEDEENGDKVKVRLIPILFPTSCPLTFLLLHSQDATKPRTSQCLLHDEYVNSINNFPISP